MKFIDCVRQIRFGLTAASMLAAVALALPAWADVYPNRPINMVVPFPPGGPTDVFARIFAAQVGKELSQTVIVDNRSGAAGNIGVSAAARSLPDGYTILFGTASIAIAPSMFSSLTYDPSKDLKPVAMVGAVPALLLVQPDGPKTVKEFVEELKRNPGKYSYATSGHGTATHLITELFARNAGVKVLSVPYRGSGPAQQALLAKTHLFTVETASSAMAMVRSGAMRPIAVASEKRSPALPTLPTLVESGFPNVIGSTWNMVFLPTDAPDAVAKKLNAAINKALSDPETRKKLADLAVDMNNESTPASAKAFLESEIQRWKSVVAASGIQPN